MKIIALIVLNAFALLQFCYAQNRVITGRITDEEKGAALPGVSVGVKGTKIGTTTDADGKFSVEAPARATLVFSFVGYGTKELQVNNLSVVDVVLTADNTALNEVVVVGYGKEKKVNLIGSVATVSSKDIVSAPVSSVSMRWQVVYQGRLFSNDLANRAQMLHLSLSGEPAPWAIVLRW